MNHELTYEERAIWGDCPACHAEHGEPCNPDIGFNLGSVNHGVHLGRLQRAPFEVEVDMFTQLILKRIQRPLNRSTNRRQEQTQTAGLRPAACDRKLSYT